MATIKQNMSYDKIRYPYNIKKFKRNFCNDVYIFCGIFRLQVTKFIITKDLFGEPSRK